MTPIEPTRDHDEKLEAFVWYSTNASVERGILSVLACAEVVFAIALYLTISIWLDTQAHLWISILVAPLLLLRSVPSTALGVQWFEYYVHHGFGLGPERAIRSYTLPIASVLSIVAITVFTFFMASRLVANQSLPSTISLGVMTGYFAIQVGIASALSIAANEVASLLSKRYFLFMIAVSMIGSVTVGVLLADVDVISGATVIVTTTLLEMAGLREAYKFAAAAARVRTSERAESRGVVAAKTVLATAPETFLTFAPGVFFAGLLRSVGIRFVATVRHLFAGFLEFPLNWWRTIFVVDLVHPPEVVPGYEREDLLRPGHLVTEIRAAKGLKEKIAYAMGLVIMFVPAYIYRITIKSTSWFYIPIIYLTKPRFFASKPGLLADLAWNSPMEWWRRLLAAITIGIFAANQAVAAYAREYFPAEIISPLEYIFLIDPRSLKPWQWFNLASAVLTVLIFVWAGSFKIYLKHFKRDPSLAYQVGWRGLLIEYTMRLRNISTTLLLFVAFLHVLFWRAPSYLPAHILELVRKTFGWT